MKHAAPLFLALLIAACPACADDTLAAGDSVTQPGSFWVNVAPDTRRVIARSWLSMDELTRPPFPVYAKQFNRNNRPAAPSKAAASSAAATAPRNR